MSFQIKSTHDLIPLFIRRTFEPEVNQERWNPEQCNLPGWTWLPPYEEPPLGPNSLTVAIWLIDCKARPW